MKYYLIKCEDTPNLLNTEYIKVSANGVPYGSFYGHKCVELTEEEIKKLIGAMLGDAFEWNYYEEVKPIEKKIRKVLE